MCLNAFVLVLGCLFMLVSFVRLVLYFCSAFAKKDGLTPEEEEDQRLSKRKMLGNIQFIGELGKCGMLHESVLHKCVQQVCHVIC